MMVLAFFLTPLIAVAFQRFVNFILCARRPFIGQTYATPAPYFHHINR